MKTFFLILLVFLAIDASSQSIKMKITGLTSAEGEDVIAFEASDTIPVTFTAGGGGSSGIAVYEFVKIKKLSDASTNELFKRSLQGTHTQQIDFEFYDANAVMFYKIVLKDVLITHFSYLSPECANCTKLFHQVWFDYARIEVTDVVTNNVLRWNRSTRATY